MDLDALLRIADAREAELRQDHQDALFDGDPDNATFVAGQLAECIEWRDRIQTAMARDEEDE